MEALNKSFLDLSEHAASGAGPDAASQIRRKYQKRA